MRTTHFHLVVHALTCRALPFLFSLAFLFAAIISVVYSVFPRRRLPAPLVVSGIVIFAMLAVVALVGGVFMMSWPPKDTCDGGRPSRSGAPDPDMEVPIDMQFNPRRQRLKPVAKRFAMASPSTSEASNADTAASGIGVASAPPKTPEILMPRPVKVAGTPMICKKLDLVP